MSVYICICRHHNLISLQLQKCVSLQNTVFMKYLSQFKSIKATSTCQKIPTIIFDKSKKLNSHDFQTKNLCRSYATKSNNEQSGADLEETITRSNNIVDNVVKRIELIKEDVQRLKRVYQTDVIRLHYEIQKTGNCSKSESVFLLECCGKLLLDVHPETRTLLALSIWKTLKQFKDHLTLEHYNALLTSLADNKHPVSVKDILSEIRQDGLTVNATCYLNVLRCVCEVGDIEQATDVMKLMLDSGFGPNKQILDYILLSHGRAGDLKTVERLMDNREDSSSLTVALKVSAEAGQKDLFSSYFKRATALSETERLDVSVSLAIGNLHHFIPQVLSIRSWSDEGIVQANNTSIRLVHLGYPHAGMNILMALKKYNIFDENTFGSSFIEELLKSHTDVSAIIDICNELSKYNTRSLVKATECALTLQRGDIAIKLITEMKNKGFPIRPHYFWPLIISESQKHGKAGSLSILSTMLELGVKPDFDTLQKYVLPRWNITNPVYVVEDLCSHGLILSDVMTPVLYHLLFCERIQEAVELCSTYKSKLDWNVLLPILAHSFVASGNVSSTVELLSFADSLAPSVLVQRIAAQRRNSIQSTHLQLLLQALNDKGYSLPSSISLQKQYSSAMPAATNSEQLYIPHPKDMTLEELECHLIELKAKKLNTRGVLRKLFQLHCGLGNVERATQIKNELFEGGFEFSAGMEAALFQLYVSTEQTENAEECLKQLHEKHPRFKIDPYKIVDFATALVNKNQYSQAIKILRGHQGDDKSKTERNCWRLLNAVSTVEGVEGTREVIKVLLINNYAKPSGQLLSPLLHGHLERNDLIGAVKEFINCYEKYEKTPMLYDLLCRLSSHADSSLFEKVLSIGRKLHGSSNINVMHIMVLAECNMPHQLFKLISTPNFKLNTVKLLEKCSHFVSTDNCLALENIVSSLLKISSIKVEPFCYLILQICVKHGNYDAAMKLWASMQESNITPSEKFSRDLKALQNISSTPELK